MTAPAASQTAPRPDPVRMVTPAFVALAAAALVFFVAGGLLLPVAPRYALGPLGADELGLGISIGAFSIAAVILRPVVGWSSDRFGRRPLLVAGSILTVASLGLHLVATTLPLFTLARGVLGAGEAFFLVAALASGADLAPPARRGEALSFLSLTVYLGVAIGPPVGELLLGIGSYPAVWLGSLTLAAVAVGLSALTPETAPVILRARGKGPDPSVERRRGPLLHPAGLLPGAISFLGLVGMAGFFTYLPVHAGVIGLHGVALPFAIYGLVVIVLRVVGATWPDRFGAVRVSGAALVISAVGLAIIGLVPSEPGILLGSAVFAAGVAFIIPALLTVAISLAPPEDRGVVVGTTSLFWDLSFGIGPVALGIVAARTGFGSTFVVAAVVSLLGAALLVARRSSLAAPPPTATPTAAPASDPAADPTST